VRSAPTSRRREAATRPCVRRVALLAAAGLTIFALDARAPRAGRAPSAPEVAAPAAADAATTRPPPLPPGAPPRSARQAPRYPEWLTSREPLRRRAALEANGAAWDARVLPLLERLEHDPDAEVRRLARRLVRRYLIWGPAPPSWRERRDANRPGFEPWDRAGLRAWRARGRDAERGASGRSGPRERRRGPVPTGADP
jgi:hypothetical protein